MSSATSIRSRWRAVLGLALVSALAVYNLLGVIAWDEVRNPTPIDSNAISAYLHRFDDLRDTVSHYRVAGYRDDGQHAAGWFLAQYALAPTILVQSVDPPVVVANFHTDTSTMKQWVEDSLRLIHDYGGGVRLYEGKTK